MAEAPPSQGLAVTSDSHNTSPHQRPPTALGLLGKFPREVRNQLYRVIFQGAKAIFASQWRRQHFPNGPKHTFGILTASKTVRIEAEPFFYPYCQFSLDVRFSQDHNHFVLAKMTQHLQRKLPNMHKIILEANPFEYSTVLNGFITDQVAFIPTEPHVPYDRGLTFPEIFEDLSFNGHEMVFNLIFHLEFHWAFWNRLSSTAIQNVVIPFWQYETVRFYIEIQVLQKARVGGMVVGPDQFRFIGIVLQDVVKKILGPGTKTNVKQVEPDLYVECMEFHPKSHFEAMAKREGLE